MSAAPEAAADPRAEYQRRLETCRAVRRRLEVREAVIGNGRVAVFLAGVVVVYLVFVAGKLAAGWLALPAVLFLFLAQQHEGVRRRLLRAERTAAYYEKGLARLGGTWAGQGEPGNRFLAEDHPYAVDLDLFGNGSLFERLCTARTRAGQDRLAGWLLAPSPRADVLDRQAAVDELRGRIGLREEIALLGCDVPDGVDLADLARWGAAPRRLAGRWTRFLAAVLVTLVIATAVGRLAGDLTSLPFAAALLLEAAFGLCLKKRVDAVLAPIDRKSHDLALFAGLLARVERERFTSPRLVQLQAALQATGRPPSQRIVQMMRLMNWLDCRHNTYFALIAPLLLWATQLAFAFEAWRAVSGPAVGRWLDAVAEFEALCALAAYSYENPDDPFPEVVAAGPCYAGEGLGHPLLPPDRCVRNDVSLGDELRLLVVSGSNMSGKSTLLRTVGVNAVLALAGAPVRARRLRLSPVALGATLRIQDSLQAGRSRFFAEIRRIRQLVDLAKGPLPLLFLLDEILHGTNSHDRRIGAEAVVRSLVERGAIGLVTTHDLALTHITERLGPKAANIHFADRFENGTITFDYHIQPGVVQHSNALALMRAVGLEV